MVIETGSKVLSEIGDVTILVQNAGIMPQCLMLSHSEQIIRKMYDINVLAHHWLYEAFLPKMMEKNRGHIVALSSIAGIIGFENIVPYCGSKFAVKGTVESLREELRKSPKDYSGVSVDWIEMIEFTPSLSHRVCVLINPICFRSTSPPSFPTWSTLVSAKKWSFASRTFWSCWIHAMSPLRSSQLSVGEFSSWQYRVSCVLLSVRPWRFVFGFYLLCFNMCYVFYSLITALLSHVWYFSSPLHTQVTCIISTRS